MNKFCRVVFWTIAFFLLAKTNVSADTATFQQGTSGYNANACATLDRWNPDTNTGNNANIRLRPEIQEPIIKFDLSSLPNTALVQNAKLKLYVLSRTNANPITVRVYKVMRDWDEMQTTWHKANTSTDWSWVGANSIFTDRYGFSAATVQFTTSNIFYEMDITPLVREWVRYPQTNKGIILLSESPGSVAYSIGSNNNTNLARRPILEIDYSTSTDNDYYPSINIINPTNDAFLTGNVNLRVDAGDDRGIQQVNYLLDDNPFANVASSPYSYNWNTDNYAVGKHILKVVVVDSNNQTSESAITVNLYQMDNNILTIGQITDTHVGTSTSYEPADKTLYTQRFQQGLADLNNVVKPAVIIHTGDIVSILDPASGYLARSIINQSVIPIKTIAGNHDNSAENYLYYFGPFNSWFDIGQNRFVGFSTGMLNESWIRGLLVSTSNKGIVFSHYLIRIPQGSTADPNFYQMSPGEATILQNILRDYQVPAYLSGHYHQPFLLEDYVSHAVEIGGPALSDKGTYEIITIDNGIVSSNEIALGNWPAIVITSPQRFYSDGGNKEIAGSQKIRTKIYDSANIVSVVYKIDDTSYAPMNSLGNNVWEITQNFDTLASGVHTISVQALDSSSRTNSTSIQVMIAEHSIPTPTPTPTSVPGETILINAGGSGDTGYTKGQTYSVTNPISNTDNQALYQTERYNMDEYRFNIPNGNYVITLKFAEIYFMCNKINCRVFNVDIENQRVLTNFDIFKETGALYKAIDKTFVVSVNDGQLNINFQTITNASKISGIQIVSGGTPTPTLTPSPSPLTAIMVNVGGSAYGNWKADMGYTDGQTYSVTNPIANTNDQALYQTERYNMSAYRFNIPNGNYSVTLKFAEIYFMCNKINCRLFNVTIENQMVLINFDIFKEAGALYKAIDKTFITNVSDGQLNINFTTIKNASKISGIVITPQ
ncbi:hypothetical protein COY91_02380 [Candidatus Shapirobacteria bacterium CG_4_10_14_0_8_um_filter_39_15]|nr:MAG: hypothetical protein COY91_02380 [Candidatus Shapirobacteria bacterium CG_4_10_14_0_8_um_filter_39_15]